MEDDLEQIRTKRLAALQETEGIQSDDEQEAARAQNEEYQARRQMVLRRILTPDARARLSNLRMAKPEFVQGVEDQLISLASSGRIGVVNDAMLKQILQKVIPRKKEIKIERR